jgi:hypothetical protein
VPGLCLAEVSDVPEIKLPEVNIPEFHRSDVRLPELNWSGLKRLDLKAPEVHLPEFTMPKVDITMPKVDMPNMELPDMATIRRFGRPAPKSNPIWPWALVAVAAGLFAAFWLATSTMTGPKVRQLAGRARQRIEEMRTARSQREGEDGEPAAAGWAGEQDWHESAEGAPTRDGSLIGS